MAARASTRVSIAWSGADPIEDTDTLVLTIDGYSLDLRVFVSGPDEGKIDWSTVAHVGEVEGSTKENPILKWDHIIDSRPPTDMPDQGKFETLPNGDVIEIGIMHNPKTNLYEDYVETWRRMKLPSSSPYVVLESQEEGVQAYLGRVGEHALGLAKSKDEEYCAWRDRLESGEWKRICEFGSAVEKLLPRLPSDLPVEWSKGETVHLNGDSKWTVKTVGKL
ncbi:hypothetical protein I302_105635 [Kwoniella bestiolae CBS 10118]|uniref:Protein HRI1 n=1 Tax=Kwoniella bestiolae CBS 10118 TaxID=1296100 RepID=A0A1B9G1P6_9TREE|nr:hypothetical protein I302_04753 [Kwoniella bestiolae CBS 10118]OCF24943.1 hypothetical protein I302_04753 [Kwoniella bestiolae CBS 10118]